MFFWWIISSSEIKFKRFLLCMNCTSGWHLFIIRKTVLMWTLFRHPTKIYWKNLMLSFSFFILKVSYLVENKCILLVQHSVFHRKNKFSVLNTSAASGKRPGGSLKTNRKEIYQKLYKTDLTIRFFSFWLKLLHFKWGWKWKKTSSEGWVPEDSIIHDGFFLRSKRFSIKE